MPGKSVAASGVGVLRDAIPPWRTASRIPHLRSALSAQRAASTPAARRQQHSTISRRRLSTSLHRPPAGLPSARPRLQSRPARGAEATGRARQQYDHKTRVMLYVTGSFGFLLSVYLSYVYVGYTRAAAKTAARGGLAPNADVSSRWDDLGRDYDDEVDCSERLMGLRAKRRRLVASARGKVLEVSVGTGRNMEWLATRGFDLRSRHKSRIERLVFNDQSRVMLGNAQRKFEELQRGRKEVERFPGAVEFVVGDAGIKGVITRPEGGFDTIIQTMGLCSMTDPVGFLKMMGELCRQPDLSRSGAAAAAAGAASPVTSQGGEAAVPATAAAASAPSSSDDDADDAALGGRILLLEHGRGSYRWINRLLDANAATHADHYGCWINKDIGEIVKDSGLHIERIKRYHFGTTWEIVLRPRPAG